MTKAKSAGKQRMQNGSFTESFDLPDQLTMLEEENLRPNDRFDDPEFEAYAMQMLKDALADPRPAVPIAEVRRRLDRKFAEARKTYGQ
jgi:hypothetical protein